MLKIEARLMVSPTLKEQLVKRFNLIESEKAKLIFYEIINHSIDIEKGKNIIFLSDDDQDVFKVLIYQPLYFVRLSHLEEDLSQVALLLKYQYQPTLTCKIEGMNIDILIESIVYIESYGHYLTIYTTKRSYCIRENISQIIQRLPDYFIRIHKSYIINQKMVTTKTSKEVILNNQIKLPIGKTYKE